MVDDIEKSILRGEYALGVFLDITGAFDNLSLTSATSGMDRIGIHPNISGWYSNYLHSRQATAELKGCLHNVYLTQGTPQGGVLSPLIWNIAFDDLLTNLNRVQSKSGASLMMMPS